MFDILLSNPYLLFVWIVGAMVLTLVGIGLAGFMEFRMQKLPAATEWVDLDERVLRLRVEKAELEEKNTELQRLISSRDHVAGETAALEERRDAVKLELAALDDARKEIDDVKRLAADAATELALKQSELEKAQIVVTAAVNELEQLNREIFERGGDLQKISKNLKEELERLNKELDHLRPEIDQMRSERGALLSARSEAAELAAAKAIANSEIAMRTAELAELAEKASRFKTEIEDLGLENDELLAEQKIAEELLRNASESQIQIVTKFEIQKATIQQLEVKTMELIEQKSDLDNQKIIAETELKIIAKQADEQQSKILERSEAFENLQRAYNELKHQETLLQAKVHSIEADLERVRGETVGGTVGEKAFDEKVLADLREPPKSLEASHTLWKPKDEESALFVVSDYLRKLNLEYPDRVVRAFHTALKINDIAQLTVLAGVSGTGKSLLPRRYAEAMGIRFLPFAVEPRWDSPQDLLGFYNYIEKRFKATDLARALVHIDPYNTSKLAPDSEHGDDMMIVLLDEMNLARVEYYFSEFLSRLEARPSWKKELTDESRLDAMIPVEIQGKDHEQIRLYPPHNMLFVGTMNDDESTQSLSDKVLDRGNIMQFAAPHTFAKAGDLKDVNLPDRRLSFTNWRAWVRTPDMLDANQESKTKEVIQQLAKIMNECGRPFGHRLNTAIRTYVANYPLAKNNMGDASIPLSDQVEFRILPKLRGLSLDDHSKVFEDLKDLVANDLKDTDLASRIQELVDRQRTAGGLFNWRGITRG